MQTGKGLLKELSEKYLKDAKEFCYTWKDLHKKFTHQKIIFQVSNNNFFNSDDDIFQKENTSIPNYEIIRAKNVQNKKINSFTNEFKYLTQ